MVKGEIMMWSVHAGYCVLYFLLMGSHSRAWYRLLSGSERRFGSSSLSIRIIHAGRVPAVVNSWGASSNWVISGISLPLVILSNTILLASMITILVVDCWEHILALDVSDIHERRWRTGSNISVWMDVWRRNWQWRGRPDVTLLKW